MSSSESGLPRLDPGADLHGLLIELARLAAVTPAECASLLVHEMSRWSVGQHLEHVLRADELNLRAVEAILSGRDDSAPPPKDSPARADFVALAELSPAATTILTDGVIPRGLAESPQVVLPPLDPDAVMIEELRQLQISRWRGLEDSIDRLGEATGRIAHPLLGAFRAVDWVRFARVHTRHHRLIVEEIVGSQ